MIDLYDAYVIMGVTGKTEKYRERLSFFKKYGLNNYKNHKIKLILLVGTEDIKEIYSGWNYEIEIIKDNYDGIGYKCYNYYYQLSENQLKKSKWFIHVDDDSITNIGDLLNKINSTYNYKESNYIVGEIIKGKQDYDRLKKIIKNLPYNFVSEYEIAIRSQKSLSLLINNKESKDVLKKAVNFCKNNNLESDIILGVCAFICDIKITKVDYLSHLPYLLKYMKKEIFHIHYIYNINNKNIKNNYFLLKLLKTFNN